jgi:glycosyltransferase involved in cell wall biosynthesis
MRREVIIATLLAEKGETGVQAHLSATRDYLLQQNDRVTVVTPFSASRALVYPLFGMRKLFDRFCGPLSVWWYRYWHYVILRKELKSKLKSGEPAVIYAQCPLSAKAALDARVGKDQRVILAVHFNGSQADEWAEKGKIRSGGLYYKGIIKTEETVLPLVDGIVYVSEFMRDVLRERIEKLDQVASTVIPNFCSRPVLSSEKTCTELVTVGTLEPRKNQQYALQILAEANRLGRRYRLTIIGDGPDRTYLEKLADSLGLRDQVIFAGRLLNAAGLIAGHRVLIHTALRENLPVVLIEALACGLPIMASPVGGIPEIYTDGVEGYFFPFDDPSLCAMKLILLLENRDLYETMSKASITRYESKFTPDAAASKLRNFISQR